jgi:hypothetical protein
MKIAASILATVATLVSLPMAADAQYQQSLLRQNQGGMSQAEYNRCFQLALARGEILSAGTEDRRSLDLFIDACLRGKIRPGPPAIPPPSARLR